MTDLPIWCELPKGNAVYYADELRKLLNRCEHLQQRFYYVGADNLYLTSCKIIQNVI